MKRINLRLSDSMIHVNIEAGILNEPWMKSFLQCYSDDLLFLPKSIMVFYSEQQAEGKARLLEAMYSEYNAQEEMPDRFILRSLMWYIQYPLKIEVEWSHTLVQHIEVAIRATKNGRIAIMPQPSYWLLIAFYRSQFAAFITQMSEDRLEIDVTHHKALRRLDHILSRNKILFYRLSFDFDEMFIQNLLNFYNPEQEILEENLHYYEVLECSVGDSPERIKANYKKLAKNYHPDRVYSEDAQTVQEYTQKFQLLQEAYLALVAS